MLLILCEVRARVRKSRIVVDTTRGLAQNDAKPDSVNLVCWLIDFYNGMFPINPDGSVVTFLNRRCEYVDRR